MNSMRGRLFSTILICVVFLLFAVSSVETSEESESSKENESSTPEPTTIDLDATVKFDGTQFIITNNDYFDWENVKLEINSRGLRSGYIYNAGKLESGTTYTVGAMQFAKKDGERFNPFTMKALNFSVWCDLSGGKNGLYYGTW